MDLVRHSRIFKFNFNTVFLFTIKSYNYLFPLLLSTKIRYEYFICHVGVRNRTHDKIKKKYLGCLIFINDFVNLNPSFTSI